MAKRWIALIAAVALIGVLSCSDKPVSPVATGTISGRVTDATDDSPIAGASVTTTPGTNALITDNSGNYIIADVEEGTYIVKATKTGYNTGSVSVAVKPEKTTIANIILTPATKNQPPNSPTNPNPATGAIDQPISLTLSWSCSDPDAGDSLSYDICFGNAHEPISVVSTNQSDTSLDLSDLGYGTTYHWQVVAKDNNEAATNGPVWSFTTKSFPNNRIVFASNRDGDYEIYSSSTEGTDIIQLTHEPGRDWWPRISPNRHRIAFSSDRTVESHIYLMNMDGTDVKKITTIPISGYHNYGIGFCWSPDGQQLLYSNYDVLYRIDADGGNLTEIARAPGSRHFRECDSSPLGDKIVALTIGTWVYNSEIYIMDSDGSDMTVLVGNSAGAMGHPSFSPGGNKVAYSWDVSGHEVSSGRQLDARIFIINIDGTGNTDISIPLIDPTSGKTPGTNDFNPAWSPDGAKIIFTNAPNDDSAPPDIWIMDIDGENREKLITDGTMPDWR